MTVDLRTLADEYGTPLYVYDLDRVTAAYNDLVAALPRESLLCYSVKVNPHPLVSEHLQRLGAALEVSSLGELALAGDAGPKRDVVVTGPVRTDTELAALRRLPSPVIVSVESPQSRERVTCAVPTAHVMLRVNLPDLSGGYGLSMGGRASKFGLDGDLILRDPAAALGADERAVSGLHFFSGTNMFDEENLVANAAAAIQFVLELHERTGWLPSVLDLGGGFGHAYGKVGIRPTFAGFGDAVASLLDAVPLPDAAKLIFESGRYLVGAAGTLLLRVMDVKESRGERVVLLDGGINCAAGSQAVYRLASPDLDVCRIDASGECSIAGATPAMVGGPLCTPIDTLGRRIDPDVDVGEVVAIPNLGAYGLSSSLLGFLSHDVATEVVVSGGDVADVSKLSLQRRSVVQQQLVGRMCH